MSGLLDGTRDFFKSREARADETFDNDGRVRTSRRAQIDKKTDWKTRSSTRLARIQTAAFGKDALITAPNDLSKLTLELVNAVVPALSVSFQRNLVPVAVAADEGWPVDTGLSRSLLSLVFAQRTGSKFEGIYGQAAPYGYMIRFRRRRRKGDTDTPKKPGRHVWTVMIRKPGEKAVDKIIDEVGAEVVG